jgi:hypothetical protein
MLSNNTWDLVLCPPSNVVVGKWIFKHQFKKGGSLDQYKTY